MDQLIRTPTLTDKFAHGHYKETIVMHIKIGMFCSFLLIVVFVVSSVVFATSFDCEKARSEVEKLICGDEELSRLDDSLNKAYQKALKRSDNKSNSSKTKDNG